jgi:uncharacterized protein
MSVSEEREQVAPAVQPAAAVAVAPIADPGPLGLAAFATTTFLLMAVHTHWTNGNSAGTAFIGYALAYGGGAQFVAGMWEFRNRNVFGATAFSTWGAFWIGLFIWLKNSPAASGHDVAWILIAFAIVNAYLLLFSTQVNLAVFGVFLFLEATLIVLAVGDFVDSGLGGITQAGGYIGLVTAILAWYTSAAGIGKGLNGRIQLPVGKPLI